LNKPIELALTPGLKTKERVSPTAAEVEAGSITRPPWPTWMVTVEDPLVAAAPAVVVAELLAESCSHVRKYSMVKDRGYLLAL
jgi:hypothetical protein